MIVQAASNYRVGMARRASVCALLHAKQRGAHNPPWFDAACREQRCALRTAVQTGQSVHACEIVQKRYKIQVRWSKRVLTQRQKEVFLNRGWQCVILFSNWHVCTQLKDLFPSPVDIDPQVWSGYRHLFASAKLPL
eukprot:1145117-Pelagomonas_calceolata.AAC.2